MVDLLFDEKKFISVRRASQETGYTSDYIGQLCRHKKIPAKLVGRTWFVDFDSLLKYKNQLGSRASRKIGFANFVEKSNTPRISSQVESNIAYKSESVSVLPKLLKDKTLNRLVKAKSVTSKPLFLSITFAVASFVMLSSAFSWLSYLSPRQSEILDEKVAEFYDKTLSSLDDLGKRIGLALVSSESLNLATSGPEEGSQGLVVFPDTGDRQEKNQRVMQAFSDDAEIFFDEGGESGVIRPVFRPSDSAEDYAFVLVPIKEKK